MKKWILVISLVLLGALAFAACGDDDGDGNAESAGDGDLPQVSDDARPSAGGEYRVTVSFNEDAEQADLDEIGELLAAYDADADYIIQESFPPTGVATLITDADDFCETVVSSLEAEAFVTAASCGPQLEPGDLDPDGTVGSAVCAPGFPDCVDTVVNGCDGDECTGEDDGDAPVSAPVCAPGFPDCVDTIVNTGDNDVESDLPLAPPGVRLAADNQYTVTIRFNETVSADELDEVGASIRDFDPNAAYVIQESFPPTGLGNFVADTEDACLALTQGLEAETFVTSVSCGPRLEPGDTVDPDEPVVADLP